MASPIQASSAWIRARDRYVEDLNEKEQQTYFGASPESLLEDASTAENFHATNSTIRRVMEKLQPFVAAIEQYGEAVDVYSNTYSLALAPIWGSIKVLLHIAREFGKYFDKLVDMFARIGDVLPRFKTYERLFSNHERLIQALSIAYLDIITFCTNAKTVFRRGQRSSKTTFKMTFKLLWKPFDQQFGQQLSDFRQHQKNVEREAGLANMIESADARAMVLADQKQVERQRREDNRLRIIAMLNSVDYEAKHRKLQNLRHAGTGEWLFQEAAYVTWRRIDNSAAICCRGIPGCGKTILASILIDRLMEDVSTPSAKASNVIYYYCDYADQRTLQLDRILGSLLKQLFLNYKIPEHIETQLLQIYAGGTRLPAEMALSAVFCSIVALYSELYIVFDGLDECAKSDWQAMLKVFNQVTAIRNSNVKTFTTCVEEGSVSHHLANTPCIQFSCAATMQDIRAFVTSSVRSRIEDRNLRIRNPKLEQDIISELVSSANGMFLWVFFQLEDICESSSDAMIRETLRNLPYGLGDTFRRILLKIAKTPSKAELARKVFAWATVAKRPLHVEELKEAVAFEPDDKAWDEDKVPHEDLMFECCRGLIIKDEADETVHFAHHTVRQYLTGGLTTKVDPFFEISLENADLFAGKICVAYLSFSDFETQITANKPMAVLEKKGVLESGGPLWIPSILGIRPPMSNIPYRLLRGNSVLRPSNSDYWKHLIPDPKSRHSLSTDLKDKYRLLCYAIKYWEPHTRSLGIGYGSFEYNFCPRLGVFVKHKTLAFDFRPWGANQHIGPYGCEGCPSSSTESLGAKDLPFTSMIHYAAEVGNLSLLRIYDVRGTSLDHIRHERYQQTTLLIACRHNRIRIVKYLTMLEIYDIADGRAVNAAATAGHAEVVQYLINLEQYSFQKGLVPLLLAAKHGIDAVVGVLADAGADLDGCDEQTGMTIVETAAFHGRDSVIRTLIRRGAWFTVHKNRTNALHLAVAKGHATVVRTLLELHFPIHETDSIGRTALHIAVESEQSIVEEILYEYGADVDPVYGSGPEWSCQDLPIVQQILSDKRVSLNSLQSNGSWMS